MLGHCGPICQEPNQVILDPVVLSWARLFDEWTLPYAQRMRGHCGPGLVACLVVAGPTIDIGCELNLVWIRYLFNAELIQWIKQPR